jgi:hypothetical protein
VTNGGQTRLLYALMSTLLSLAGCSDPEPSGSATGGTGGSGNAAGAGGAGSGGGAGMLALAGMGGSAGMNEPPCNDLVVTAREIPMLYSAETPVPAGGELVDGIYVATTVTWYEREAGPTLSFGGIHVELEGTSWREAEGWPTGDNVNADIFFNFQIAAAGTTISFTQTCPAGGEDAQVEYTADEAGLTLFTQEGPLTFGYAFERK